MEEGAVTCWSSRCDWAVGDPRQRLAACRPSRGRANQLGREPSGDKNLRPTVVYTYVNRRRLVTPAEANRKLKVILRGLGLEL